MNAWPCVRASITGMRAAVLGLVVACSSEVPTIPSSADAGAGDASADVVQDAVQDAGTDATAADAATTDAARSCVLYETPPPARFVTQKFRYDPTIACDTTCGALGPYGFRTETPSYYPPLDCSQVEGRNTFCCAMLRCGRDPSADAGADDECAKKNGSHAYAFVCDGPTDEPPPTLGGCEPYAGPGGAVDGRGRVCCLAK